MCKSLCLLLVYHVSPSSSIREQRVSSLFSTLINTPNAPSVVVKEISRILVRIAASTPDADLGEAESETREEAIRVARSLLSLVHQRHLELLRGVADDVLSEVGVNGRKKTASELLASFSLVSAALAIGVFVTETG